MQAKIQTQFPSHSRWMRGEIALKVSSNSHMPADLTWIFVQCLLKFTNHFRYVRKAAQCFDHVIDVFHTARVLNPDQISVVNFHLQMSALDSKSRELENTFNNKQQFTSSLYDFVCLGYKNWTCSCLSVSVCDICDICGGANFSLTAVRTTTNFSTMAMHTHRIAVLRDVLKWCALI